MTFLEPMLSGRDIATARAVLDFKNTTPMGAGFDPELRRNFESALHDEVEPISQRLRAAVSAHVSADPGVRALSEQFEAELVATRRRGRRG